MCIISNEIKFVKNTKILCALSDDRKKQLIVYGNEIDNVTNNNAMILPVPNPQTIKFHDLSNYTEIFYDCSKCFYRNTFGIKSISKSASLIIYDVGSYQVSIAMDLNELQMVDNTIFTMSPKLNDFLTKNYNDMNFGFIICKLKKNNNKYHPFCYSHNLLNNKIFIPTKHYHVHNVMQLLYLFLPFNNNMSDDWSHEIYLYNVKPNEQILNMNSSTEIWCNKSYLKNNKFDFLFGNCIKFTKICIIGKHENIDFEINNCEM